MRRRPLIHLLKVVFSSFSCQDSFLNSQRRPDHPCFSSANVHLAGLVTTATAPVSTVHLPIVLNDAGSPTRQEVQVLGEDDVFESVTTAAAHNVTPNPTSQRILQNLQAPTNIFQGFEPRQDRLNQIATAANAQGIFTPQALIFVAK